MTKEQKQQIARELAVKCESLAGRLNRMANRLIVDKYGNSDFEDLAMGISDGVESLMDAVTDLAVDADSE